MERKAMERDDTLIFQFLRKALLFLILTKLTTPTAHTLTDGHAPWFPLKTTLK